MNFSSPQREKELLFVILSITFSVKVSITKQGVSSFYKNQLKWQWQKFMLKAQFLPRYEKLHNEKHCCTVLYSDSNSSR